MSTEPAEDDAGQVIERIRLIIDTTDEIRRAVRLRALKQGKDVTNSDIVNAALEEALADEIREVRGFIGKGKRKKS